MSVRNAVDKFLADPELSSQYNLTSYHREILRVIARYCDMQLHYCCCNQKDLAEECGMSHREFKNRIAELDQKKHKRDKGAYEFQGLGLIYSIGAGRGNKYRIGEVISGIANE